jgi:hypothetical protein
VEQPSEWLVCGVFDRRQLAEWPTGANLRSLAGAVDDLVIVVGAVEALLHEIGRGS